MLDASKKPLSAAQEDYVRAISKLGRDGEVVTISALAGTLGVTLPSVSAMMRRLVTEGLVRHAARSGVRLTPRGQDVALMVHRRHRLIETFLVEVLGLDWSEVHEDAEALEHHLSDRLVKAIDRYLDYPQVDPHGHPIPSPEGKVIARKLTPLIALAEGDEATIGEVTSDDPGRIRRWKELGLVPGAAVHVLERNPLDGTWRLEVNGTPRTIGLIGLTDVYVEIA